MNRPLIALFAAAALVGAQTGDTASVSRYSAVTGSGGGANLTCR